MKQSSNIISGVKPVDSSGPHRMAHAYTSRILSNSDSVVTQSYVSVRWRVSQAAMGASVLLSVEKCPH